MELETIQSHGIQHMANLLWEPKISRMTRLASKPYYYPDNIL